MATMYCEKCHKTMVDTNFYTYKDGSKCELCKACLTMHVNSFDPTTFLWILEKFDYPWLPWEWNSLRDKAYQKDPYKMTGMSVIGKYFSKMKLKQNIDPKTGQFYTWADSERLQAEHDEKVKACGGDAERAKQKLEEMKQAYENGEITEAQYQTYAEINAPAPSFNFDKNGNQVTKDGFMYPEGGTFEKVDLVDVGAELTQEDKVYLAMKWGRLYKADEWVALEQLYNQFMETFDIQGAARIDTLKLICKTSLKMNQAIDCGDVDTYQKLSRVYDAMMKAAKFTEAQRKEEKSGEFDSVGQVVYFAEKEGGAIHRHVIDTPIDIVDKAIDDLKNYNRSLIINDPALSQMLENLIKRRESALEQKKDLEAAAAAGLDYVPLSDEDHIALKNMIEEQKRLDWEEDDEE